MDVLLVYAYHDEPIGTSLAATLASQGITVAKPLPLWRGQPLIERLDARLSVVRYALV